MDPEMKSQLALLETAGRGLSEHFECVQIFVSNMMPGEDKTRHLSHGSGNWFARYGQVKNWITVEEERTKIEQKEEP